MRGCAGLGDRFFSMVEGLVGKALIPEDMRQEGVTTHGQVETITNGSGAVALAIVKGQASFQMPARGSEIAQMETGTAHLLVSITEKKRVVLAFGEAQILLLACQPGA